MKVTGKIVCTRTPVFGAEDEEGIRPVERWDVACEWHGGRIAAITRLIFDEADPKHLRAVGKGVYQLCQYRLCIVGMKADVGTSTDIYFVMRDGVLARTLSFVNRQICALFFVTARWDARLYRLAGHPLEEGDYLPRRSLSYILTRLWNPQRWEIA